ncbi:hypothetical protein PssB301D_02642 [Pseudomonas syringae pv. syringae str. B301D-R]|nr:hypothetical protein PssB301D_02642 [Pseudomonas syringae pv. syringae str. B301D-R]
MSQYCGRSAILQHVGNTFRWISRVERHVTAARLEDRQQADDHIRTALNADADAGIRLHALLDQRMRQTVGLLVKLAIRQALFAVNHCHPFRRALDLGFEHPVNGLLLRVIQCGVVERHQQLLALDNWQDRQTLQ